MDIEPIYINTTDTTETDHTFKKKKKMAGKKKEADKKKNNVKKPRVRTDIIPKAPDSALSTPCRANLSPEVNPLGMRVHIDVRETELFRHCQTLFHEQSLTDKYCPKINSTSLLIGDVEICDTAGTRMLLIERKTIADLVASIKDGRYAEQSYRLHHASQIHAHNVIYLIEGTLSTKQKPAIQKMVKSALISLQVFKGFSVVRTNNAAETAAYIMELATRLAAKIQDRCSLFYPNSSCNEEPALLTEDATDDPMDVPPGGGGCGAKSPSLYPPYSSVVKACKKQNVTFANIHSIMLSQIPGISPAMADILLNGQTLEQFIARLRGGDRWLFQEKITLSDTKKTRRLSKGIIQSIYLYFFNTPPPSE